MTDTPLQAGPFPSPWGEPVCSALLKQSPEDFQVDEVLGFAPDGAGEHLWLLVEKRGINTDFIGGELAALLDLRRDAISWSGLKDRQALTTQWFSVHWPGGGDWTGGDDWREVSPAGEGEPGRWRVLQASRSSRKLRRGAHEGNRFGITLRAVAGDRAEIEARLQQIASYGVPNYFGLQRFGIGQRNISQGLALLADRRAGRRRRRDNRESLWVSALRSALFNRVLAARVQDDSWRSCLPGDVLQLDGRNSFFVPEPDDAGWPPRLASGELHPTGPLPGDGRPAVTADVAALEATVLAPWQDICADLAALRVPGQRRALRLRAEGLRWQWLAPDVLRLDFTLTAGAFATSMLQCLARLDEGQAHALSAEQ